MNTWEETEKTILQNRERYLAALDSLGSRHSRRHYFATSNDQAAAEYSPDGLTCVNGLAMIGLGIRTIFGMDYFDQIVSLSLGYKPGAFKDIDLLNSRHGPVWLREYIEQEAFSTPLTWLDEYERHFVNAIPEGFSFDKPDGEKNWYYCPSCDTWLFPVRVETVTTYRMGDRRMKNGGNRVENGRTRHYGGEVDAVILRPHADSPDSTTVKWICHKCKEELPEEYATEIENAPTTHGEAY
jgi:ribosomal protein L44E